MQLLEVRNLSKRYPQFALDNVSFALEPGYIMGFIGRNGAGKTTTIKAILHLIHAEGTVKMNGVDLWENELSCKQQIGFVMGEFDFYRQSKLQVVADVTRRFYQNWDEAVYERYLKLFELDSNKKVSELSAGMRVKFGLAMALSHDAKLLILDEPTSGLDPISRDDLLSVFQSLVEDGQHSILFSTHIISDLEKCADYITYIKDGKIVTCTDCESFRDAYRLAAGTAEQLAQYRPLLIGWKEHAFGFTGLLHAADAAQCGALQLAPADMESIMIYTEKEDDEHEAASL